MHCLFTVVGTIVSCVSGLMSGIVSLDLSTRAGSLWTFLLQCLYEVVLASLDPVDGDPPTSLPMQWLAAKQAVLDNFVPDDMPTRGVLCTLS